MLYHPRPLTAPQIRAHIKAPRSSNSRHISSAVGGRLSESGLEGGASTEGDQYEEENCFSLKKHDLTTDQCESRLQPSAIFGTRHIIFVK